MAGGEVGELLSGDSSEKKPEGCFGFVFLIAALLRYNSHDIQFSLLRYRIQDVYSELYNHAHEFQNTSIPPKRNPTPVSSHATPCSPQLLATTRVLSVSRDLLLLGTQAHGTWPFVTSLPDLARRSQNPSMLQRASSLHLCLPQEYSTVRIYHNLNIGASSDERAGCFHVGTIMNNAVININAQGFCGRLSSGVLGHQEGKCWMTG